MKPKPEVRVLAKQLFEANRRNRIRYGYSDYKWSYLSDSGIQMWDAVAREAIKRLKGGEK